MQRLAEHNKKNKKMAKQQGINLLGIQREMLKAGQDNRAQAFVQGAMGAFGSESVVVEEALLKVASAMAIADGLQGIKEAKKSFKGLKAQVLGTAAATKIYAFVQEGFGKSTKVVDVLFHPSFFFSELTWSTTTCQMTQFCVLITCSDGSDQIHGADCGPSLFFSDKRGLDIYPRGYIP